MRNGASSTITTKRFSVGLRFWAPACGLAVICISLVPDLHGQQNEHASLIQFARRKSSPAFELMTQDGEKMRLSDYRGKVVLLNFWATDCGGCELEISSFIELERAYKDNRFTALVSRWTSPTKG
jgi:thiol-disulfide isomerase/thioredoxin